MISQMTLNSTCCRFLIYVFQHHKLDIGSSFLSAWKISDAERNQICNCGFYGEL